MGNIIDYAREASDSFADRPLCRVDVLCLAWMAYLRLPSELGVSGRAGVRIADLCDEYLLPLLASKLHDVERSQALVRAMAASPRFGNVRACLHAAESDEAEGMQFSATTFVLPEGVGSCVAYRGTDDSLLGWKENFYLIGDAAIPAQQRAARYLDEVTGELGGRFWVAGHSKGGALAVYAARNASAETRAVLECCLSFDGPGLAPELRGGGDPVVPVEKLVPRASLVGMLFEDSQEELVVVRSSAEGVMQHAPFSWEVEGSDFVCEHGLDYDAWRLARRLNDCLATLGAHERTAFAELLGWLVDATAETSFSGLLRRWSTNRETMRAALATAPQRDRELFDRVMDELVATLLLGSRQELGLDVPDTPQGSLDAATRRLADSQARVADHLTKLDRLTGRR